MFSAGVKGAQWFIQSVMYFSLKLVVCKVFKAK